MGNVLTYCPVAPSSAQLEPALLVGEAHRGAVDFDLGGVARRLHLRYDPRVPRLPLGQLFGGERVGQRQHGTLVGVLGQRRCGNRADALRRAVGILQLGMLGLEGLELAEEPVVLGVRDLRRVEHVVGVIGALDLLAQSPGLLRWCWHGCQVNQVTSITVAPGPIGDHEAHVREATIHGVQNGSQTMQGAVLYGPGDVRYEERELPRIQKPTDAVIRLSVSCVCGSDLWPYRGAQPTDKPAAMGHEYCGIVEEVGSAVKTVKPGRFVIGSFFASDNSCPHCRHGYQTSCQHREPVVGAQAPLLRVPMADGTLVATAEVPSTDLLPSLLAVSDVLGTGWFAADAANVKPGSIVVVVGDGAVGLLGVLSAKQMGAERIIAMSRHETRQRLAREFGATDIVTERGEEGAERIKEMTKGVGADSV